MAELPKIEKGMGVYGDTKTVHVDHGSPTPFDTPVFYSCESKSYVGY